MYTFSHSRLSSCLSCFSFQVGQTACVPVTSMHYSIPFLLSSSNPFSQSMVGTGDICHNLASCHRISDICDSVHTSAASTVSKRSPTIKIMDSVTDPHILVRESPTSCNDWYCILNCRRRGDNKNSTVSTVTLK
jgi:hypothetical protein